MYNTIQVPDWATNGPEDLEYRTYKMLSHEAQIRKDLYNGLLYEALEACDSALDFMYHYDAERMVNSDIMSTKLTNVNWDNIEFMYATGEEMANFSILDDLVDRGIQLFESLHSEIREHWRVIEREVTVNQAGTRPYFIGDGFVLVDTPDNKVHVYSFKNPKKDYNVNWKSFKMEYVSTHSHKNYKILEYISQIKEIDEDKIVYRVNIKNSVNLEGGPINVVSSLVFMQLRKDYSF